MMLNVKNAMIIFKNILKDENKSNQKIEIMGDYIIGSPRSSIHFCKNCGHSILMVKGVWQHFYRETRAVKTRRNICGYICRQTDANNKQCLCTKPREKKLTENEWRQHYETRNQAFRLGSFFHA